MRATGFFILLIEKEGTTYAFRWLFFVFTLLDCFDICCILANFRIYTYTVPHRRRHVNMVKNKLKTVFFRNSFENANILRDLNAIFLKNRGYVFSLPKVGDSVILVVSGGLDSIMLWFHLLFKYRLRVYPIFFTNPITSSRFIPGEDAAVGFFYNFFRRKFPDLVMPVKRIPSNSDFSLTGKENLPILIHNWRIVLANARITSAQSKNIYLQEYPTRLARYFFSAYEYGLTLQAKGISICNVFFGIVPNDNKYSRESTLTVLRSLNLYICLILGDWTWQITGPVEKKSNFYYTKETSIQIGVKHKIPLHRTWSCARQYPFHCGLCNMCRLRQTSFKEAGVTDKTLYIVSPDLRSWIRKIRDFFNSHRVKKLNKIQTDITNNTRQRMVWNGFLLQNKKVRMPSHVETFWSGNMFFLRNHKTEEVATINLVGRDIVTLIEKRREISINSIVKSIIKSHPKTPQKNITEDVRQFIKSLLSGGYIEIKS